MISRTFLAVVFCSSISLSVAIDCYTCTSDDDGCDVDPDGSLLIRNNKVQSDCAACKKSYEWQGTCRFGWKPTL